MNRVVFHTPVYYTLVENRGGQKVGPRTYAYAGFYRPPTEDHVDSGGADMSWPAEEAVTALANEGYIPSPLADAGDTGPTLNGIDFWDDAGEPQRPTLRARMQSDSISFTRQTQRAGVSSTLFATPEPLIPGSRP